MKLRVVSPASLGWPVASIRRTQRRDSQPPSRSARQRQDDPGGIDLSRALGRHEGGDVPAQRPGQRAQRVLKTNRGAGQRQRWHAATPRCRLRSGTARPRHRGGCARRGRLPPHEVDEVEGGLFVGVGAVLIGVDARTGDRHVRRGRREPGRRATPRGSCGPACGHAPWMSPTWSGSPRRLHPRSSASQTRSRSWRSDVERPVCLVERVRLSLLEIHEAQPEPLGQRVHGGVPGIDQLTAALGVLTTRPGPGWLAVHPTADATARLEIVARSRGPGASGSCDPEIPAPTIATRGAATAQPPPASAAGSRGPSCACSGLPLGPVNCITVSGDAHNCLHRRPSRVAYRGCDGREKPCHRHRRGP